MERTFKFVKYDKLNIENLQVDTQILMITKRGKYVLGKVVKNSRGDKFWNTITNDGSYVLAYAIL